ncbi:MAG: sortase family protein [Frankiales bacterium]|nr:sortase family protein [Frankiales bacterium]
MRGADRIRRFLSGVGQVMITLGVVVLLFVVYEVKYTNLYTGDQQRALDKHLDQAWAAPPPPKTTLAAYRDGEGIARIYLPTLGKKAVHVVVEGVSREDLKKGPGHYPGTDLPGALGNMVISGHRTTYGAPFNRLDEVHLGDPIVIETRTAFFTYRVIRSFVVLPSAVGETNHVPNQPHATPTQRLLTLTTCNPKYSARTRLVVRAQLQSTLVKTPGAVPPALQSLGQVG